MAHRRLRLTCSKEDEGCIRKSVFWQHLFSQMRRDLHFIVERQGFESRARGAGSLVLRHFFAAPARVQTERMPGESQAPTMPFIVQRMFHG